MASDSPTLSFKRIFIPRFLGLVTILVISSVLLIAERDLILRGEIAGDQEGLVNIQVQRIQSAVGSAVADAVYISELMAQQDSLLADSVSFHGIVTSGLLSFLQSRVIFDEVALLGPQGREMIRVEKTPGGVRSVGPDELRDHGGHDHLARIGGEAGLTWLSPADPQGALQGTGTMGSLEFFLHRAVRQEGGGSVLLRFSLRPFLGGLLSNQVDRRGTLFLATNSGEWLLGPGAMGQGGVEGVEERFPELWSAMNQGGEGQILTHQGLFTYVVIDPGVDQASTIIPGNRLETRDPWVVVTRVPEDALRAGGRGTVVLVAFGVMLILGVFLYSYAVARVSKVEALLKVRERETFLNAATTAVRDALIVVDHAGKVTFWNPGAETLFGYTSDEVLGKPLHSLITPPELRQEADEGFDHFSSTGQGRALGRILELPAFRKDGSRFPIELSVSGFEMGGERMAVGLVRDVSERTEANSRLALADQILSSVQDMVLVADADGSVIFASPSVKDVLGFAPEEVMGDGWWHQTRPGRAEAAALEREGTARRARREEAAESSEYDREIRHMNGDSRWVRWRESPGPGSTVVGIGADVTERKEAEAARQRLTALIRHTSDFIAYAGIDGQCRFVNRGGLEMVGLDDAEEACRRPMLDFIHPDDLEHFKGEIQSKVGSGESWEGELRLLHHGGGTPVPVQGAIFPVLDEETGAAMAVGGTFKNIEERKELEESLLDAVRRAESASEAKQRFLANMSHEIRTPMNAIIGMADLLWETPLTPEQKDYVQVFRTAGDTLLALINDVLDLAKVEEGRLELERVGFDLQELLDSVVDTFAAVAHGKGLEIAARTAPEVPTWVIGDPGRIRQILSNLVGNAVKFTENGQVLVEVTVGEEVDCLVDPPSNTTEEQALLKFSVQDSGVGIPPEKLEDVFGRFTQADSSTTRRFGGSGLGLAICERLVSVMGGRIWVESTVGVGSTFQMAVRLPVTRAPAPADTDLEDLRGVRFLVVDDNAINRLILREVLHTWGAHVEESPDAMGAVEMLREHTGRGQPFRVCLLDAEMPDMDGYSLARKIKEDPGLGRPLTFMLTSHGDGRSRSEVEKLGLSGHMMKPVRRPTLLHALTSALRQQSRAGVPGSVSDLSGGYGSGSESDAGSMTPEGVDPGSPDTLRILVVDDSADNRLLIKAYLKKTDYEVEYAENGQEAVERCVTGQPIDLVFMDIQMPIMDGYEATGAIRRWEAEQGTRPMKIIALSAHAMQDEIQKSLDAGCDDHLTKPIKKNRLLEAIEEIAKGITGET